MAEQQTSIVITAVDKTAPAINSAAAGLERLGSASEKIKDSLAALAGASAITGLATSFAFAVKGAIDTADEMGKMAEKAGLAVETFSALAYAAKKTDVPIETMQQGIKKLSVSIADAAAGNDKQIRAFSALGVAVQDSSGKVRSAKDVMLDLATVFEKANDGPTKVAYAIALMGKNGSEMIPALNKGGEALRKLMADAQEMGKVVTQEVADMADKFNKDLDKLTSGQKQFAMEVAKDMLPGLNSITTAMIAARKESGLLMSLWVGLGGLFGEFVAAKEVPFQLPQVEATIGQIEKRINELKAQKGGVDQQGLLGRWINGSNSDQIKEAEATLKSWVARRNALLVKPPPKEPVLKEGKSDLDPRGLGPKDEKEKKDPYESIIKSAREWIAVANLQLNTDENLTEAGKALAKMEAMSAEEKAKGTAATRALATEELKRADILQKLFAAKKMRNDFALFDAKELDALREEGKILNLNAISLARYQEEKKYENQITEKFFNVSVSANGEIVKTRKYLDDETDAALKNAEAHKKIAGGLAEEGAAKKLIQQYDQEIAQLKIDNTIYFDDAARQLDMLDQEAAKRRILIESIASESAERQKAEERFAEWRQASQSRIGVDKLKEAWQSVDQVAHDAFVGMFEKGQDTFKNLTKVLKSTLIDALYQMTVKKWVFSIFADMTGANSAGGIAGATGSAGSALSLASSGNSLFNLASGGSSITSGFLGGMASVGSEAALGAAFVGPSATLAGGSVGAGASVGGLFGSSAGAISAALPWIGGALAIASLLGGMFGKGGAPKQNYGTGFIGNATGTIADAPYNKIAGQIGSGQAMTGQDELQKAIYTDSVKAIVSKYAPSSSYDVLLNSQINVKGKSQNINDAAVYGKNGTLYNFGPDTGQGQDAAQSFFKDSIPKLQLAIITDAFRSANADYKAIADSIVGTSTDMTDALSGLSADAVAAMQANLSGMATLFDAIKTQINGSVTGEAVASITKLAGGFATLTTQVNDYYSNFYSQEEKASKAHEQLATEFEKLNLAMPSTRDGFRKIVESLDITTEAGQKSFAALMGLSGAFASITDAAEIAKRSLKDIAAERDGLQARLDQAMGNTAAIRQRELDALDPSNRALQQQIYALEDTKAAAEAAAAAQQKAADAAVEAARAAEQAYKDMLAGLLSAVDNAYAGVERAVGAEKSKIDASYTEQVSALDAQYQASKAVFESQRAAAQQNLSAITQVADRLKTAVKSMQIESDGLLKNQRLMASNTLNAALSASQAGASLANFPGLEDALATVAKPAEQLFSTFQDYAREQGRLGATIDGLGKNADAQVSVAQMTLDSINGASQQAEQIYQRQKEQLASQHAADIKALDDILKNGQDQVDALKGIDKSVLSVAGAMAGLASAIAAFKSASGGGGGSITTALGGSVGSAGTIAAGGSSALGTAGASGMQDAVPSYSAWTGGVSQDYATLSKIFGADGIPGSAITSITQAALTSDQWAQIAASSNPLATYGQLFGATVGANIKTQDGQHAGIYDSRGQLLGNVGNYYIGSGAFTGAEYGLGQLPGSVSLAGEQAIVADNNNIANMLGSAPASSAIEMLYQSILGRSVDTAGADYWAQQMQSGLTSQELAAKLMGSEEYLKKINGFASGGGASAGYYMAGERGPELIHSDSATRIYPAEQTSALMARLQSPNGDMAAVLAELRAVKAELEVMRGCSEGTERHTRDTKNILRNVTQDGETFQTTVVA